MSDNSDADAISKPPFRGCVFCYSAEMSIYGLRKGVRRLTDDD